MPPQDIENGQRVHNIRHCLVAILHQRAKRLAQTGVPYIARYVSKGREYSYFRPTRARLRAEFGTPAFFAEYFSCKDRLFHRATARLESTSLAQVYARLEGHSYFQSLPIRTRNQFRQAASWLIRSFGEVSVEEIDAPFGLRLRDHARRARGAQFANVLLALFKALMSVAIEAKFVTDNPFNGIRRLTYANHGQWRDRRALTSRHSGPNKPTR